MTKPKLFIFDLDGVITDTAEFHFLAWKQLAEELGITIDRRFNEELKGISRMESLEKILALDPALQGMPLEEKKRLAEKKNDHYKELIRTITPDHILPGVEPLIKRIKEEGILLALGSASKNAPAVLQRLGLYEDFDFIVDPAKVKKGKPDPEIFTRAADHFRVPYSACVGVEDSAAGIEAINRAGMFSVGVGAADVLSASAYIVPDTSRLDFDRIVEKFNRAREVEPSR
ncbi:beta-phosphoglucomutase [Caldibacillus debilis]|jgi:beta-phosphoglucomutase|uniref:beta-phosphoglucomutase n=1 Tax=Caldibacillus debilis TaxID=301148 RepID=UPI000363C71D|nr:beta-phosphoglucomutase [Caldibacillus debilis]MBY6274186.1 beta-phosphoglucomutase [Bacillaceae bacterium]REJ25873.1 MAG: beta-phosphoglucomutase [Caldibacillus debilis]